MEQCTTTRDGYRCDRKGAHVDCETTAPAYAEGQRATVDGRIAFLEAENAQLRAELAALKAQMKLSEHAERSR